MEKGRLWHATMDGNTSNGLLTLLGLAGEGDLLTGVPIIATTLLPLLDQNSMGSAHIGTQSLLHAAHHNTREPLKVELEST